MEYLRKLEGTGKAGIVKLGPDMHVHLNPQGESGYGIDEPYICHEP